MQGTAIQDNHFQWLGGMCNMFSWKFCSAYLHVFGHPWFDDL